MTIEQPDQPKTFRYGVGAANVVRCLFVARCMNTAATSVEAPVMKSTAKPVAKNLALPKVGAKVRALGVQRVNDALRITPKREPAV